MDKSIVKFHKRRDKRLSIRGIRLDGNKYHGNTRLPFGLCEKEGIEVKDTWTPHDAWEALKGKGYVPEEEYKKLEEKGSVKDNPPKTEKKKEEKKVDEPYCEFLGEKYTDVSLKDAEGGKLCIIGKGKDGEEITIGKGSINSILKKLKDAGFKRVSVDIGYLDVDEFDLESYKPPKAIATIEGTDYLMFTVREGSYGSFYIVGTDIEDNPHKLTKDLSPDEIKKYLKDYDLDINSERVIIAGKSKEDFDEYEETEKRKDEILKKQEKEKERIEKERNKPEYKEIEHGKKYVKDIRIVKDSGSIMRIVGTDEYGDTEVLDVVGNMDEAGDVLDRWGIDEYEIGRCDKIERKVFEYEGKKLEVPRIEKSYLGVYKIKAEAYGKWEKIQLGDTFDTETEAREYLKSIGCNGYRTSDGSDVIEISNFQPQKKPAFGMRKVSIVESNDGGYAVYADTKRFGVHQQMYGAETEEECRKWLEENNVETNTVKTVTLVPNHYVKRNHTAKSLEEFDKRREEFAKEDTCAAETIKYLSKEQKQQYTDMMSDIFNTGAYRMRRKPNHFANIIIGGRFKNLFETGTSGGSTSTRRREALAEKMFGIVGEFEDKDREKYGYLGSEDDEYEASKSNGSWYGGIIFKFKKEAVEDNSTYTMHDSLDNDAECAGYCGNKATIEGLSTCYEDELEEIYETYQKYKNGELTRDEFFQEITIGQRSDGYLEIQYHGELTTDKIESIMFEDVSTLEETLYDLTEERKKKLYKALDALKIPIKYNSKFGKSREENEYSDVLEYMRNKYPGIDT